MKNVITLLLMSLALCSCRPVEPMPRENLRIRADKLLQVQLGREFTFKFSVTPGFIKPGLEINFHNQNLPSAVKFSYINGEGLLKGTIHKAGKYHFLLSAGNPKGDHTQFGSDNFTLTVLQ